YRIRLSTSFGEMPEEYLDVINAVATATGAYSHATADLIEEALDHAFTWRLHAGWRPFTKRGGYIEAGFGSWRRTVTSASPAGSRSPPASIRPRRPTSASAFTSTRWWRRSVSKSAGCGSPGAT